MVNATTVLLDRKTYSSCLTILQRIIMGDDKDSSLRRYFREYCDSTGIHGFKYLAEKRTRAEKILWSILISISVSSCVYLIGEIYGKFEQKPVIVSFATSETPIYTIPFPAVTICPMTKARKTIFNFTDVIQKLEKNESVSEEDFLHGQYMSVVCDHGQDLFPNNLTFTNDFYDKLDNLRIPLEQMLFECKYMKQAVNCAELFFPIILDESVCYSFNMLARNEIFNPNVDFYKDYHSTSVPSNWSVDKGYGKEEKSAAYPLRAFLAGADNALEITFHQNDSDLDYLCIDDIQGYSILLHQPYKIPLLKKQYFQVPFDRAVIAVIQPSLMTTSNDVRKYSPAKRKCYFTTERNLKYFKQYSSSNCKLECLVNHTLESCGCVNFYMPREANTPVCGNGNAECLYSQEFFLKVSEILKNVDNEQNDFFCDCKPLCTELTYSMEQSVSSWEYKEQFRAKGMTEYDLDGLRFAKLSVFFKQESFLTAERNELYGPTDFLANFGGLLGLFTGFSLLSAVEIVYFLSVRLYCNFRKYGAWTGRPADN